MHIQEQKDRQIVQNLVLILLFYSKNTEDNDTTKQCEISKSSRFVLTKLHTYTYVLHCYVCVQYYVRVGLVWFSSSNRCG